MDLNPLLRLKEDLLQIQSNTSLMQNTMKNFDDRLTNLDEKMRPVQDATASLSRAKRNIALSVVEIEKTHEYFRISANCQGTINGGINTGDYNDFFEAMDRLSTARKFFAAHREIKSSGSAIINIDHLLKKAINMCLAEVETLLSECGGAIEFMEGAYQGVDPLEETTSENLREICQTLNNNNEIGYFDIYARVRTAAVKSQLDASLKQLGVVDTNGNHVESKHTDNKRNPNHLSIPYVQGIHPLKKHYALVVESLKGEELMWAHAFPNDTSEECVEAFIEICTYVIHDLSNAFLPYFPSTPLVNDKNHIGVLSQSNALAMRLDLTDVFVSRYEEIKSKCLIDSSALSPNPHAGPVKPAAAPERRASLAVTMGKAMGISTASTNSNSFLGSSRFGSMQGNNIAALSVVNIGGNSAYKSLNTLRNSLVESCLVAICDMGDAISVKMGNTSTPQDTCDLHPISGHVLHCCKEIISHRNIYARIYGFAKELNMKAYTSSKLPPTVNDLIVTLLNNLVDCLMAKGENFAGIPKLQTTGTPSWYMSMGSHSLFEGGEKEAKERLLYCKPKLFLINNLYSIRLYLSERREVLQRSTTSSQPVSPSHGQLHTTKSLTPSELKIIEFHDVVDEKLQLEMQHFILAVLRTLVISPDDINFSKQFENDKTNKGKMLKSMFSAFNGGIAALLGQQAEWRIAYSELRVELDSMITAHVVSTYREFYNTNSKIQFSKKHMDQYVKYTPAQVEEILLDYFTKGG